MIETVPEILKRLNDLADPKVIQSRKEKFNISNPTSLGLSHKTLDLVLKDIAKSHELALALFDSNIYEARLLSAKMMKPKLLTRDLMNKIVICFDTWEICDSFSMSLFAKSPYALSALLKWVKSEKLFIKRASFAMIAGLSLKWNKAKDDYYLEFLNLIRVHAVDDRPYIYKAVSWALRSIGKRNEILKEEAILVAQELETLNSKSAKYIAKETLRELK